MRGRRSWWIPASAGMTSLRGRSARRSPSLPRAAMRDALRHFVAEFIGTFALVFVGGATMMMAQQGDRIARHGRRGARADPRRDGHGDDAHLGALQPGRHARLSRHAAHRAGHARRCTSSRSSPARWPPRTRTRGCCRRDIYAGAHGGTQSIALHGDRRAGVPARGDRDVLPRVRRLRHRGRSAGAEDRRLRDRPHVDRGDPRDRPADRRRR